MAAPKARGSIVTAFENGLAAVRSLLPQWYQCPIPQHTFVQFLLVNWLLQEVRAPAELAVALAMLSGWRRREVLDYLASYDWTVGACDQNAKVLP
jgi:hypothetical protein